ELIDALQTQAQPDLVAIAECLRSALADHVATTKQLLAALPEDRFAAMGGSFDYMMQTGYLFGGWQLARGALVAASLSAGGERVEFCQRKLATAQFYMERLLPRARAHAGVIMAPAEALSRFALDWF
ncbi:MAG: acyl-CoA dehydrogenase C-terminal domain-containing protein, partial [Halieaceae bacterium]